MNPEINRFFGGNPTLLITSAKRLIKTQNKTPIFYRPGQLTITRGGPKNFLLLG